MKYKIGIILGSDSDFPQVEKGIDLLREYAIPFRIEVSSAHRTPERTVNIIREYEKSGCAVIIAAAGGAAHLPGVVASHTLLPVLGIPIESALSGVDSLYSIVQMPGGIPVATFGIGTAGGVNAVLFALQIIGLSDTEVREKLADFRKKQKQNVLQKSKRLQERLNS
jgi:phosphoribosylaminoimidazole carboxylase PurE protein